MVHGRTLLFIKWHVLHVRQKDWKNALEHIERSIVRNYHNMKARNLKAAILRKMGFPDKAEAWLKTAGDIDVLDLGSRFEQSFISEVKGKDPEIYRTEADKILEGNYQTYLELAIDYLEAGMVEEAEVILNRSRALNQAEDAVYTNGILLSGFLCDDKRKESAGDFSG